MTRILFSVACLLVFTAAVSAQDLEDGQSAYQAGDYKKTLEILQPLAEQGNSQAQAMLGMMYDNGQGVDRDQKVALQWYIKAAEQGMPVAQHDVGVRYFQGIGVEQNYQEAAKWWEQAANAGLADSRFNLGLMYYRGLGVKTDYPKAAEHFRKAAEQGHGHAQYSIAVMHAFGQGVEKNYTEALKWFREAAAQGIAQAQFNLGIFYENGYGLDKDMNQARQWYQRAADQGLDEARKKLASLDQEKPSPPQETAVTHPEPSALSQRNVKAPAALAGKEPAPEKPVASTPSPASASGIKREDWVWQQRPDNYTLQLASLLSESEVLEFIQANKLENGAAYLKIVINGTTRYTVIYGVYKTYHQAQQAVKALPSNLQQEKPWVRNFGLLQKMLKEG
ncbi:MAG: SPOR domain-containing protein [Gammaproteobacteria bacterium]